MKVRFRQDVFLVREEALEVIYGDRSRPIMTWFWSPTGVLAACHETVRIQIRLPYWFRLLHKTTNTLLTIFFNYQNPTACMSSTGGHLIDFFFLPSARSLRAQRTVLCSTLFQRIDRAVPKPIARVLLRILGLFDSYDQRRDRIVYHSNYFLLLRVATNISNNASNTNNLSLIWIQLL